MKRVNLADKLVKKRQAWISRTCRALDISEVQAKALLATSRQQSIRLNPLRGQTAQTFTTLQQLGWTGEQYAWMSGGYTVTSDITTLRDSDLVASGAIFIQNAASWLPVLALNPQPGEAILDVCAAPGGKTSHIAALTNNQAQITANDNSRIRLAKLRANLDRLGAHAQYTLFDATQLVRKLDGQQFDRILIDAPCSGEGLMHIERDKDFATWSVAHIKRLQQLQKRILTQAWQLLKPGGTLVYSTCTMAPEENEAVIDYLLRSREDAQVTPCSIELPNRAPAVMEWNGKQLNPAVQGCLRVKPSQNIEAFFVCKLEKRASDITARLP